MSYTAVIGIWPGEKTEQLTTLSNAYAWAPVVWSAVGELYLQKRNAWLERSSELWPLNKDEKIPASVRAVLSMTYDYAYVAKKDYARAAQDIKDAMQILKGYGGAGMTVWTYIRDLFRTDPDVPGIGFSASQSENLFEGTWEEDDDGNEEYAHPKWDQFWSIYDEPYLKETTA